MQKFMQEGEYSIGGYSWLHWVSAHSTARALQYITLIGARCISNTHGRGVLMKQLKVNQYSVQLQ